MTSNISSDASSTDFNESLWLAYQRLLVLERFKSGFLARTSHELRSPINTIVSLHQLILEDLCESPEEEKEFIEQSKTAALKMLALFDKITAVSKLDIGREPATMAAVDLSFLLPEVEMLTALQAANQNVRYKVDSPTDELEIDSDAKWLKNILVGLIQDAIPHTKVLHLKTEQTEQSIAIVIECDRAASLLQTELNSVSEAATIEILATNTAANSIPSIENIQLSTGLVLAIAQTTLPLINGKFAVTTHPASAEHSCLRCTFPVSQSTLSQ